MNNANQEAKDRFFLESKVLHPSDPNHPRQAMDQASEISSFKIA